MVGLSLALFRHDKGLPQTIRSAFAPIFGEQVWGRTGHGIDILAVFATLFGLATSLGFGATQATNGVTELFGSGDAAADTRGLLRMSMGNGTESGVAHSGALLVLGLMCWAIDKGLQAKERRPVGRLNLRCPGVPSTWRGLACRALRWQ